MINLRTHLHLCTHACTQILYALGGLDGHSLMQAGKEPPGHPGVGGGAGAGAGDGEPEGKCMCRARVGKG